MASKLSNRSAIRAYTCIHLLLWSVAILTGPRSYAQSPDPPTGAVPPSMKHPLVPSHGNDLLGVFYLASGTSPHPTAILFHGFPGFEQNLDLAQALRRAGWNVLALHYRGSWGVGGAFSFMHCVEDADAEVNFITDPKNVALYRIDVHRIVVIGHSLGGAIAVSAAARNPIVKGAVLLSAWNVGAKRATEDDGMAKALASGENLAPIQGADGTTLAHEAYTHRAQLDMNQLAPLIAPRPILIITANDGSDQFATPFESALHSAGDDKVFSHHFATDHSYSGTRPELIDIVLEYLKGIADRP